MTPWSSVSVIRMGLSALRLAYTPRMPPELLRNRFEPKRYRAIGRFSGRDCFVAQAFRAITARQWSKSALAGGDLHQPGRGVGVSLRGSFLVPRPGSREICFDARPGAAKIAELELGYGQALLGGSVAPPERPFGVLRCTLALQQHDGEIVLRVAVALLSRAAVPFDGLGQIADDTSAGAVHCRQLGLRAGVAALGGLAEP